MKKTNIPAPFKRFFEWFCKPELFEELQGDLEEAFEENKAFHGASYARSVYRREVVKMLRPSVFRYLRLPAYFNHFIMFRNYFKVSLRSLMRNPLNSFINILGLAVAIGTCVFVYAFARWTYSTDQFHEYKNEVYLITFSAERDGTAQQYGFTPRPLGEMLRKDFSNIRKVCRVEDSMVVVKHGDNVFHEQIRYADPEFLEMFTFPLKWGSSSSLVELNSIVLSKNMAIKYFGEQNPVGMDILVKFDEERSKVFKITGVAKEFPKARTISFDFLANFENLQASEAGYNAHDWKSFVNATLVQIENPSALASIEEGMEKYRILQNQAVQQEWAITSFAFEPLATLHQASEFIKDDISRSSSDNYASVVYLSFVGAFMLALACFNYINIAIVSAAKRLKEIGIRKTIGATRSTVIIQFLSENVTITFLALVLGLVLGLTFFIPGFEHMWQFSMDFKLSEPSLWLFLPAILLFTSIASGIYPSLYISKFQVVGILKGTLRFGKKNPLTKILLGFQLILACIFITSAITFTQNSDWLAKRSWGYNQHGVLYAEVPDYLAFEQLKTAVEQDVNVVSIAGAGHHLGKLHSTAILQFPDRRHEADQYSVDAHYFETMGLKLKEGRVFKPHHESDRQTVVVNELLVRNMGLEQPLGQVFRIDSLLYEIIGVVSDFHSYSFYSKMNPAIFKVAEHGDYRFLALRVQPGLEQQSYEALQNQWVVLFPETPFLGGFQEDVWGFYYDELEIHAIVWQVAATIAVVLAGLGLYGLITLNVAGRIREFSIRKVLGAGLKDIAATITRRYVLLFVVALFMGAPLSYELMKLLFDSAYTYHRPVGYSGVTIAVSVLVLVLLVSVAIQIRNLSKFNPVKGLKVE